MHPDTMWYDADWMLCSRMTRMSVPARLWFVRMMSEAVVRRSKFIPADVPLPDNASDEYTHATRAEMLAEMGAPESRLVARVGGLVEMIDYGTKFGPVADDESHADGSRVVRGA